MFTLPIFTSRLRLRALNVEDVAAVHRVLGDRVTTASVSFGQATEEGTEGWVQRRVADQQVHGFSMWAVELRESRELVGLCGFFAHAEGVVELGYVIRADHWRRGLASEAVPAVLDAASAAGHRVIATIRSTNVASIAVARSAGLAEDGHVDDERGTLIVFRSSVINRHP